MSPLLVAVGLMVAAPPAQETFEKLKGLEVTDPKAEPQRELIRREQKRIEVAAMK